MALDNITKQSYETFIIAVDFGNNMTTDEELVLASCDVSAMKSGGVAGDSTSTVLTVAQKAVDGTLLQIRVKAGVEADSPYKITFKGVTDLANQWEKDINLTIEEL